jgi:hypothetical protein
MSTFLANYVILLLSCALEDIQPINGFKWTVGGWDLLVEKGVTDDEGWQYARKWSLLRDSKKPYDHQAATVRIYYLSFFCFLFFFLFSSFPFVIIQSYVRRRRWKRSMEINLESVHESLPYELYCRVQLTTPAGSNFQTATLLFVELFVNDQEHDNGALGPPHWFKDFTIPLTHLSPFKKFKINVLKSGKLLTNSPDYNPNNISNNNSTSNTPNPASNNSTLAIVGSTEECSLADVMSVTAKTGNVFRKTIYTEKSFSVDVEWKIVENTIFHVINKEKFLSKGELSEMIFSEAKLSQRLKEKIIMLSLALGNEKCTNSLLREITSLMIEGHDYLDDLDLIEILDDVNQIEGGNQRIKVLQMLLDSDTTVNKLFYPNSSFSFGIFLEFNNQQRWNLRRPNNSMIVDRMDLLYDKLMSWFFAQPSCNGALSKYYHKNWLKELKSQQLLSGSQFLNQLNAPNAPDNNNIYSVILLLKDESMLFEFISRNVVDYISLLRILSIAKYYQTGFHHHGNKGLYYSKDILSVDVIMKLDNKIFSDGSISIDIDDGSIELDIAKKTIDTEVCFPLKLPFEFVRNIFHVISFSFPLVLRLLSFTFIFL